jgi:hypothetical protein
MSARQTKSMPYFDLFEGGSIPFNGNLVSSYSANDQVLGGPRFHEFLNTCFGTIERADAVATIRPVSVNPENVEWQNHLFDSGADSVANVTVWRVAASPANWPDQPQSHLCWNIRGAIISRLISSLNLTALIDLQQLGQLKRRT